MKNGTTLGFVGIMPEGPHTLIASSGDDTTDAGLNFVNQSMDAWLADHPLQEREEAFTVVVTQHYPLDL